MMLFVIGRQTGQCFFSRLMNIRFGIVAMKYCQTKEELRCVRLKERKIKSFEEFKKSPRVRELCNGDIEQMFKAYKDYCICKRSRYKLMKYGGNPGSML